MTVINKANFTSDLVKGLINKYVGEYNAGPKEEFREIFEVLKSLKDSEIDAFSDNFTLIPESGEGQPVTYQGASERYKPTYSHVIWKGGYQISEEAIADGKNISLMSKYTPQLLKAGRRTLEIVAARILINAFDTNYKMVNGDGASLVATNHASAIGDMANTQATQTAFSPTALYDLALIVRKFKDYSGNKALGLKTRKLIIGPDLQKDAEVFLKTMNQSGTANNDVNFIRTMGLFPEGYVVNSYLEDAPKKYFVQTDAADGLKCYERIAPTISQDKSFDTDVTKVKLYMRYSFGWTDFRGMVGGGNY